MREGGGIESVGVDVSFPHFEGRTAVLGGVGVVQGVRRAIGKAMCTRLALGSRVVE